MPKPLTERNILVNDFVSPEDMDSAASDDYPPPAVKAPGTLTNCIGAWRRARGLTQEALGEAIGLSEPQISQIENGHKATTTRTLMRMAAVLDAEPGWLLSRDPKDAVDLWGLVEELKQQSPEDQVRLAEMLRTFMRGRHSS